MRLKVALFFLLVLQPSGAFFTRNLQSVANETATSEEDPTALDNETDPFTADNNATAEDEQLSTSDSSFGAPANNGTLSVNDSSFVIPREWLRGVGGNGTVNNAVVANFFASDNNATAEDEEAPTADSSFNDPSEKDLLSQFSMESLEGVSGNGIDNNGTVSKSDSTNIGEAKTTDEIPAPTATSLGSEKPSQMLPVENETLSNQTVDVPVPVNTRTDMPPLFQGLLANEAKPLDTLTDVSQFPNVTNTNVELSPVTIANESVPFYTTTDMPSLSQQSPIQLVSFDVMTDISQFPNVTNTNVPLLPVTTANESVPFYTTTDMPSLPQFLPMGVAPTVYISTDVNTSTNATATPYTPYYASKESTMPLTVIVQESNPIGNTKTDVRKQDTGALKPSKPSTPKKTSSVQSLPPWYARVQKEFPNVANGLCVRKGNQPPVSGAKCSKIKDKICYFGNTKACPGIDHYPVTRCKCAGPATSRVWTCSPVGCPAK